MKHTTISSTPKMRPKDLELGVNATSDIRTIQLLRFKWLWNDYEILLVQRRSLKQ